MRIRHTAAKGPADFKKTMKTLAGYLSVYKLRMILVFILTIVSTVFSIVSPDILGDATDEIVKGLFAPTGIDVGKLGYILSGLIALYLISFVFSFSQGFIMSGISQKITYDLRQEMSIKMDRLPVKYFDTKTYGEVQSLMINDIESINQSLSQSLAQIISSVTIIVGILVMMIRISPIMTVTALVVLPLSATVIKVVIGHSQIQFKKQQDHLSKLNGHVEEMFNGHGVVKAFNREQDSIDKFEEVNKNLCEDSWKSQFLSGLMMPITSFIGNLGYVAVCILGGYLAINGKISIGNIQAFIQYVRSFNQPIAQVASGANMLQSTAAACERVFDFISLDDEADPYECTAASRKLGSSFGASKGQMTVNTAENSPEAPKTQSVGNVTFTNVKFAYKEDQPIIKDFSFTAKPGDKIAIVGPTGAGKTTLIKLLLRYYEVNGGEISIGGKNITEYSRTELRHMFGMVLQDTWLFQGTIEENIKYGKMNATHEQVVEAAKAAHIHHHIMTQPGGYDMEISGDSGNLSQGQRQLVTIARAMLSDNPIMILDEATSSVDTRTEKLIQKAMVSLMENRTSFVIAHRLSTIRDADHIIVMNQGDIVEQGNHEELLAKDGFYAKLYNSQFN